MHFEIRLSLVALALVGVVGVGCDDDRGVAPLGAGGEDSSGGTTTDGGGAPAAGEGGAGGEAFACPSNIFAADGSACPSSQEGTICSDGADNPCEFGQSVVCRSGRWVHQEAFPAPCGGAGGGAGAASAGGAAP